MPVFDDNGNPMCNQLREPVTRDVVIWVDRCLFEVIGLGETGLYELQSVGDRGLLSTAAEATAQCFLPVFDGAVRGVDDDNTTWVLPVTDITSRCWIMFDGGRYELRGDAVLECDDDGREDHVFCLCQRTRG